MSVKTVKQSIKTAKSTIKAGKAEIRATIKSGHASIKTSQAALQTAAKTGNLSIKTAQASAKAAIQTARTAAQAAKAALQVTAQVVRAAIKAAIVTAKAVGALISEAAEALAAAIAAGGWIVLVVILVVVLLAILIPAIFGLFQDVETDGQTFTNVKQMLNQEFADKIAETKSSMEYSRIEVYPAEIITESGGGRQKLTAVLPDILARNMVYTINVYGKGAEITSSLAGEDWESGNEADSGKIPGGLIDIGRSQLHDGIEINGTLDTVYVTHLANSFSLSVLAARGASVAVSGRIDGVEIRQDAPKSTDLEPVQDIYVTSRLRMPGIPEERMYIDIWEEGRITGRITLIFRQNPVKIEGAVRFGSDGVCDFGRYIDGELARISVPEGSMMLVEFAKDGPPWMKAEETARNPESSEGREYRLLGGWKPNDPEADGRVQEGKIVFCDMDGNNREEYTVRRLNWGLPVVKMGDTWWAKYNLRGNSRDFSAQITPDKDPASHDMVAGMLVSASDSVLLELMGDQYQGGNTDGLKLSTDGQVYYYNGFSSSAQNFGDIDPASMTPDGYRIPDYDDYAFFSANDNFNIGGTGTRTFRNISGKDVTVTVSERTASFLGLEYGTVAIYDFESEGNHWVLYGPGHQWNSDKGNVARMNILLATYGDSGKSWGMEGYASSDRPGQNWMKFTAHNIWKTRTIRCIKTPVEYIYE